jgi:hypothetical protein
VTGGARLSFRVGQILVKEEMLAQLFDRAQLNFPCIRKGRTGHIQGNDEYDDRYHSISFPNALLGLDQAVNNSISKIPDRVNPVREQLL